jgi:hypothetical protein
VPDIDLDSATAKPWVAANLAAARSARRPAQPGDVLFARISPSMENGKVAIVPEIQTEKLVVSGELLVLRPRPGVDPRMIWAFLRQPVIREELSRFMTGSAGQQRLSIDVLEEVDLADPSTERWEAADAVLCHLDEARKLAATATERVAALPAAAAWSLGGGSRMQELRKFDVDFRYGTNEPSASQGTLAVLRIPNVVNGRIDTGDMRYMRDRDGRHSSLDSGDLLVVRTNGNPRRLGRVAVYESDPLHATFASYLIRVRCHDLSPDFLWAWLQTQAIRTTLLGRAQTTAGQYNVNIDQLGALTVPLLEERQENAVAEAARRGRALAKLSVDRLTLVGQMIVNHLALTFGRAELVPSTEATEAMLAPVELVLPTVFSSASDRQQRLWSQVVGQDSNFGLEQLEQSRNEHARLQHDLAVLEQLGVILRDVDDEAQSWRLPDPELEVLT